MGKQAGISRRDFLRSAAAAGAGLMISRGVIAETSGAKRRARPDDIRLAVIGAGTQGRTLIAACFLIPGVRFVAVCDIWKYHRDLSAYRLRLKKQPVRLYEDYREMLAAEGDIDAVIVATPDWVHAEHTIACLEAGKHVYCEKEMSNTIEGCRRIARAAAASGEVVQIGHQRRSNPRYLLAMDYVRRRRALGRITHVAGHWNRARHLDVGWPRKHAIDAATLRKYGYESMERFRNWRWYRKFSGGPIADLGSHQIDVFNWALDALPSGVVARGGLDYYSRRDWYDNVTALYEWNCAWAGAHHTARGVYQILNTTSHRGYSETFLGDEGSIEMSEDMRRGFLRRETTAETAPWEAELAKLLTEAPATADAGDRDTFALNAAPSPAGVGRYYPVPAPDGFEPKPVHQWHLENFFDAIRHGTPVSCPPKIGFETAVSVLRVNEAVETQQAIRFDPKEFRA
jgi:predicted dehydrogenase